MIQDGPLEVVLATQLPPDSWFEGFAVRPNNHLLAARLDAPAVYDIDAEDPDAEPHLVFEFPGMAAALNLCAIPGRPEEYSVIVSEISDLNACRWEKFYVWHLDLSGSEPKATNNGYLTDCALPLGLMAVTERHILVADSAQSCIQCLDVTTGRSTVVLADKESMDPYDDESFFGVNRMAVANGFLYYTNFSTGQIYRAPVEVDEGDPKTPVRVTGPAELVTDDLQHCDGFKITPDGSAAYTLNCIDGKLMRTDLNAEVGMAESTPVADKLVSPTCLELGNKGEGKQKLFVMCCGEIEVGWLDDRFTWKDIADLTAATVEVTVSQ
ncbi:hypothetical protein F5Y15DRAFT_24662 [Xylariaceae sp. FL0016]|nr:hypothetical protein F5Y15DRAFT_24662 [Xylariaceae sp. FL0016]